MVTSETIDMGVDLYCRCGWVCGFICIVGVSQRLSLLMGGELFFIFFILFGSWAYGELEKWFQFGGLDLVTIVGLALGFNNDNGFWFRGWVSMATVGLCLGFNGDNGFGFEIQRCWRWVLFWVSVWSGLGIFFFLYLWDFLSLLQSLYNFSFLCCKVWYGVWWVWVLFHEWIIGDWMLERKRILKKNYKIILIWCIVK